MRSPSFSVPRVAACGKSDRDLMEDTWEEVRRSVVNEVRFIQF